MPRSHGKEPGCHLWASSPWLGAPGLLQPWNAATTPAPSRPRGPNTLSWPGSQAAQPPRSPIIHSREGAQLGWAT